MTEGGVAADNSIMAQHRRERDNLGLEFVAGPCQGRQPYIVDRASVTIGRTKRTNLHIKDSSISEKHAKLEWVHDCWTIQDLGSTCGTQIDGKPLAPVTEDPGDADGRVRLQDGDLILLGEETVVRVTIRPPVPADMTVEQYLEHECNMLIQRIQARSELLQKDLRDQAEELKSKLRQAVPAA